MWYWQLYMQIHLVLLFSFDFSVVRYVRSSDAPNFAVLHIGIAGRPYNSVSTTVLHCDAVTTFVIVARFAASQYRTVHVDQ